MLISYNNYTSMLEERLQLSVVLATMSVGVSVVVEVEKFDRKLFSEVDDEPVLMGENHREET